MKKRTILVFVLLLLLTVTAFASVEIGAGFGYDFKFNTLKETELAGLTLDGKYNTESYSPRVELGAFFGRKENVGLRLACDFRLPRAVKYEGGESTFEDVIIAYNPSAGFVYRTYLGRSAILDFGVGAAVEYLALDNEEGLKTKLEYLEIKPLVSVDLGFRLGDKVLLKLGADTEAGVARFVRSGMGLGDFGASTDWEGLEKAFSISVMPRAMISLNF